MHSLDTVKTRQQGDPHMPPKYTSMGNTYYTILQQEGIRKGLYGGVQPAFLGSFTGTVCFFGAYEASKRAMIDFGVAPPIAYFTAGKFLGLLLPEFELTTDDRPHCRPGCRTRICAIRGAQNTPTTARSLQQPSFQLRVQLPLNCRRCPHHHSHRGIRRALLRIQSHAMA